MGAVVELTMYYKDIIPFSRIINRIEDYGYRVILNEIEVIDDWSYSNRQVLKFNEDTIDFDELMSDNKIILAHFTANEFKCGYYIFKADTDIYEMCIWLNTDGISFLDNDVIDERNKFVYDKIKNELIANIDSNKLLLIGIGVETLIKYDKSLQNIVDNSKNVLMWIIPKDKKIRIHHNYKIEDKRDLLIYSLE
ncbi:MAG TPA: hypothetical protein PLA01_04705 [Acetivibrio sp.]|nr:hypothetical protein [Acetivibrio sp.]